ncbi:unnamed protein product [Polarella glacialis]|uniref:Tyrosine specific protein phosphatases domain-containing protein n=1 Tax=Polarella glacialis TaxID=89957 RepID=A0A813GT76_POLGL|nr:unnamed protein product [Polarella glacialis]CAE8697220.1 unnamed protein product [Polarella glacialis]
MLRQNSSCTCTNSSYPVAMAEAAWTNMCQVDIPCRGQLFRSCAPGSTTRDVDWKVFDLWLAAGVEVAYTLQTKDEMQQKGSADVLTLAASAGIEHRHWPVPDFSAWPPEEYKSLVGALSADLDAGRKVVVHCHAGIGRTGTTIAGVWRLRSGCSAEEAWCAVKAYGMRPESDTQKALLQGLLAC